MASKGSSSKHGVNKGVYPKVTAKRTSVKTKPPSTAGSGMPRLKGRRARG